MRAKNSRGRPPIDKAAKERDKRRATLLKGLLACYEVIDIVRKELSELDAITAQLKEQST